MRPGYTVYSNHPRVWFRDTDKTALQARRNSLAGRAGEGGALFRWADWWTAKLIPYTNGVYSTATYSNSSFFQKQMAYCLRNFLDGHAGSFTQARDQALYVASTVVPALNTESDKELNKKRELLLGLAVTFDVLFDQLTANNRNNIANAMLGIESVMATGTSPMDELMDGHPRINYACRAIMALAVFGTTGYTSGGTNMQTYLNKALDIWYGGDAAVTVGGYAAMDTDRFYAADGGAGKGFWYQCLSNWGLYNMLWAFSKAFSAMDMDGEPYNPLVNETWLQEQALWFLHIGLRGNGDYFKIGDTQRETNPQFKQEMHITFSMGCAAGNYKRESLWLYNEHLRQVPSGQDTAYSRAPDFCFIDQATPGEASPLTTGLSKQKLFQNAGFAVYQHSWDKPNGSIVVIECPKYYYYGHQDLKRGTIQISLKDDVVLCNSGYHDTGDSTHKAAAFGGTHTNNWQRQTISGSGALLCDDGSATPVNLRNENGTSTNYPSGEGGQYPKFIGAKRDPLNVQDMRNDMSASAGFETLAWMAAEGRSVDLPMEELGNNSSVWVLYANTRRAYLKEAVDLDQNAERVRKCEHIWMIIKDQGPFEIVLHVQRTQSRTTGMTKRVPYHFWGNPNGTDYATLGRFVADGFKGTGKCYVYVFNPSRFNNPPTDDFVLEQVGGGNLDANGYGSSWFRFDPHDGTGGKNYPPDLPVNTDGTSIPPFRHQYDIGRYTMRVKPISNAVARDIVTLYMPLAAAAVETPFIWGNDPNYYVVSFPDGKAYKIHKVTNTFQSPADPVDTVPPVPPVGLQATTPLTQTVQLAWTPNTEADLKRYKLYYRVKV